MIDYVGNELSIDDIVVYYNRQSKFLALRKVEDIDEDAGKLRLGPQYRSINGRLVLSGYERSSSVQPEKVVKVFNQGSLDV